MNWIELQMYEGGWIFNFILFYSNHSPKNDQWPAKITFTNNDRWQICISQIKTKKVYHVLNIEQYYPKTAHTYMLQLRVHSFFAFSTNQFFKCIMEWHFLETLYLKYILRSVFHVINSFFFPSFFCVHYTLSIQIKTHNWLPKWKKKQKCEHFITCVYLVVHNSRYKFSVTQKFW